MTALALHDTHHQLNARLLRFRSQPEAADALPLAEALLEAGRYGDARGVAVQAQADDDAFDVRLLVIEGRAWLMERDLLRAQQALLEAARCAPQHAPSFRFLGEVLMERGDPLRAQKAFERCLALDPSCHEAEQWRERALEQARVPDVVEPSASVEASGVVRVADVEEQARREAEAREEQARLDEEMQAAAAADALAEAEARRAEQARLEAEVRAQLEANAQRQLQRAQTVKAVVPPPPPPEALAVRNFGGAQPAGEQPSFFEPPRVARRTANGRTAPGTIDAPPKGDTWPGLSSPGLLSSPAPVVADAPVAEPVRVAVEGMAVATAEPEALPVAAAVEAVEPSSDLAEGAAEVSAEPAEELPPVEPIALFPRFDTMPGTTTPGIDAPVDSEAWHEAGSSAAAELEAWAAAETPEETEPEVPAGSLPLRLDEDRDADEVEQDGDEIDAADIEDAGASEPASAGSVAAPLRLTLDGELDAAELAALVPSRGRGLRRAMGWLMLPGLMAGGYFGWQQYGHTLQSAEWLARARSVDVTALARDTARQLREKLPLEWPGQAAGTTAAAQPASATQTAKSAGKAPAAMPVAAVATATAAAVAMPAAPAAAAVAVAGADEALTEGRAALEAGRFQDALEALTALAARRSEDGEVQYLLGRARRGLGDLDGALEALSRAATLAPNAEHRGALADAELVAGRYADAATHFAAASEAEPDRAEWLLGHASALLGQGELDAAQKRLSGLSEAQAGQPAARIATATIALAQSRPVAAIEALSPLAQAGELDAAALALYADALYADDRVNQAAATYEASLAADPDAPEALIGRAEVHLRAERPADALPLLRSAQEVLSRAPRGPALNARMFMLFGHAYLQRARSEDRELASQALAKAVSFTGAPAEAYFWLGEAQGGRQTTRATEAYLRYLQLAPSGRYAMRARRALGPLL